MLRRLPLRRLFALARPSYGLRFFTAFNQQQFKNKLQIAQNNFQQQKYEDALKTFTELKDDTASQLGQDHQYWGVLQAQVANSLFKLMKFEEAAQTWKELGQHYDPIIEKADISKLSEEDKLRMAYPWIPYGLCLFNMQKVDEAIEATKKGIGLMEKVFGSNHQRTLEEYLRFGNMLQAHKRNNLAVEYMKIYIDKKEFIIGPSDQKLMSVKLLRGSILADLGRLEEGTEMYIQVIEAPKEENSINKNMEFTAKLLLATGYRHMKKKTESLALFEELNGQLDGILTSDHINYVKVKCLYGLGIYDQGRHDEAFALLKTGSELGWKHNYQNSVEIIMAKHYYSLLLQNLGYMDEGIASMREVNQAILKYYGENSVLYIKNKIDFSNSLIRAQKFEEAGKHLAELKVSLESMGLKYTSDYCKMMLNTCALYFTSGNTQMGKKTLSEFKELAKEKPELEAEFGEVIDQMMTRVGAIENK